MWKKGFDGASHGRQLEVSLESASVLLQDN